jgi:hypothetical protein
MGNESNILTKITLFPIRVNSDRSSYNLWYPERALVNSILLIFQADLQVKNRLLYGYSCLTETGPGSVFESA